MIPSRPATKQNMTSKQATLKPEEVSTSLLADPTIAELSMPALAPSLAVMVGYIQRVTARQMTLASSTDKISNVLKGRSKAEDQESEE